MNLERLATHFIRVNFDNVVVDAIVNQFLVILINGGTPFVGPCCSDVT